VDGSVFSRILVAYDGSERSLGSRAAATAVGAALGCPVELVHVVEADDPTDLLVEEARLVVAEHPAAGLIAEVRGTTPPGLLCLSSRGRSALGELVFGSVAARVLCDLDAPLLVVGPAIEPGRSRWRRMLVCLDGSATSASILPVARGVAVALDLEVVVLHVIYPLDPASGPDLDGAEEPQLIAAALERAASGFADDGVGVEARIVDATVVADAIAEQAAQALVDVVAMATHGRTGLRRLLAGSVAMDAIRRSPVPLLLQRPAELH
jgi:nucleotide-binding universal stress UspA family protein